MKVRVIPLSEHHDSFSAEDIEIWEVTRYPSALTSMSSENVSSPFNSSSSSSCSSSSSKELEIRSWGQVEVVEVVLRGIPLQVKQELDGVIGSVVWPSSVIASRFSLAFALLLVNGIYRFL